MAGRWNGSFVGMLRSGKSVKIGKITGDGKAIENGRSAEDGEIRIPGGD